MTKQDREQELKSIIFQFENPSLDTLEDRVACLEKVILANREYIKDYKNPYKHEFMGTTIKFTAPMLDELELMLSNIQSDIWKKNK